MADVLRSLKLLETLKELMEKNRLSEVKDAVEDLLISRVNLAVVGERGPEKAAFINALRGLGPEDSGAAQCPSSTPPDEPAVYPNPKHTDFRLWDLPGVPSASPFNPEEYMERFKFLRYNAVIMTFSQSLHPNSVTVWKEARAAQRETVYFALLASQGDSDKALEARKKSSLEVLKAEGVPIPKVFMVRPSTLEKLDFPALLEEMERDLPEIKSNALLLALPPLTVAVVNRKKDTFKAMVWAAASLSGGVSAIPVPLVSSMVDASLAVRILCKARDSLSLDDESVERLARQRGRGAAELKELRSCTLSLEVTKGEVKKRLAEADKEKPRGARIVEMALPMNAKSASRSFTAMLQALNGAIDEMSADAEKVVTAAIGKSK
ncbi:immunity-related GTPase family, q2 [Megalops cyprinoides]|uniref:immunity-related GTPase family, q2 n=1 Tax=Megalops cyprinoides TaxID=118141 RepID=UPI0018646CD3|nr:immunity-related GTPase family, q2 [Megalops cyprinoides]